MTDTREIPCYCGGNLIEIADHLLECNSCRRLADSRLICGACCGDMKVVDERNGRKVFNCEKCHKNEMLECTICHLPKSIWADDGSVCGLCAFQTLNGKIDLTPQQIKGINRWIVHI